MGRRLGARGQRVGDVEGPGVIWLLLELLRHAHELDVVVLLNTPPWEWVPGLVPDDLVVSSKASGVDTAAHDAGSNNREEGNELVKGGKRRKKREEFESVNGEKK